MLALGGPKGTPGRTARRENRLPVLDVPDLDVPDLDVRGLDGPDRPFDRRGADS